ncbi:MAG: glycosyltransferase [Verrucomicrobiota bacterium]
MMDTVCISIVSHNRAEELERTLAVIQQFDPPVDEIRIHLDRCTDRSLELVRSTARDAIVLETDVGGSIPNRDQIIRESGCDLILSLDDDSYPLEKDAIGRIKTIMNANPRIGVLTFPQISDEFPQQASLLKGNKSVASFANSGAVVRRAAYLEVSGYPVDFFHIFEEPDLALQLMDQGWMVIESSILTIRHHYSQVERNEWRVHANQARNECISLWLRCPKEYLPQQAIRLFLGQARYAFRRGWFWREPLWWSELFVLFWRVRGNRKAVRQDTFILWRKLLHTPKDTELL